MDDKNISIHLESTPALNAEGQSHSHISILSQTDLDFITKYVKDSIIKDALKEFKRIKSITD